jgi:hypothetical protein
MLKLAGRSLAAPVLLSLHFICLYRMGLNTEDGNGEFIVYVPRGSKEDIRNFVMFCVKNTEYSMVNKKLVVTKSQFSCYMEGRFFTNLTPFTFINLHVQDDVYRWVLG